MAVPCSRFKAFCSLRPDSFQYQRRTAPRLPVAQNTRFSAQINALRPAASAAMVQEAKVDKIAFISFRARFILSALQFKMFVNRARRDRRGPGVPSSGAGLSFWPFGYARPAAHLWKIPAARYWRAFRSSAMENQAPRPYTAVFWRAWRVMPLRVELSAK